MSAFQEACRVEADGVPDLVRFLDMQFASGRVTITSKGTLSKMLQETVGDAVGNCVAGKIWGCEFKVEKVHTGRLFLETWSNLSARNPGWMVKLKSDILLYYFKDDCILYSIDFNRLARWAFGNSELWTDSKRCPTKSPGRIYDYPEYRQRKYQQLNDTWARVVPVDVIEREVGLTRYTKKNGEFVSVPAKELETKASLLIDL